MWRSIEIRNFRSMAHVHVTLAPFTVVVGPNSSGKSNFVDAFVFAQDVAVRDASRAIQRQGGVASIRRWHAETLLDVTIDVRIADTLAGLTTEYLRRRLILETLVRGAWQVTWDHIEDHRSEQAATDLKANSAVFGKVLRYRLDSRPMREPQLITERTRLDENGENLAVAIGSLRAEPLRWAPILAAMQKIVPGLLRIEQEPAGRYLTLRFFQVRGATSEAEFTVTEMSEGAVRALGILIAASQIEKDDLLIIEEPEVAIHPGAAAVLFDALKAASQIGSVLITTHSPELLDAARDEEILVCDYRDGVTEVGPLDERQRSLVRDGLFSVAELMRSEPLRIEGASPEVVEEP